MTSSSAAGEFCVLGLLHEREVAALEKRTACGASITHVGSTRQAEPFTLVLNEPKPLPVRRG